MKRRNFITHGSVTLLAGSAFTRLLHWPKTKHREPVENQKLRTPLCDLLQIDHPVIQAGMATVAGPELAAAVSNAGGLGIITATMVPPEVVRQDIRKMRQLTDKPFGVNLILQQDMFPPADFEISDEIVAEVQGTLNGFRHALHIPESHLKPPKLPTLIQAAFEVIIEEKVPVFSVGLGNPSREMVDNCHRHGIKVIAMVSSLEDALSVYSNGVDILVAQGNEAGGHRSTWEKKPSNAYAAIGTLPLTCAVANAVDIPVVAAGGIVNGKGLKAALALGAQGVLVGTRFVATKESIAPESYKRKLLDNSSDNTIITDVFTGMYARVLRNTFTETYSASLTPVLPPGRQYVVTNDIVKAAGQQDNPEYYSLYAGQGIDEIDSILSAGDVVRRIVEEAGEK